MIFLAYIELLLFAICAFTVFYLLVYAIAATGNRTDKYSESRVKHRFAILIPAYQDDDYIPYTVKSFLQQEYPIDCYDIIVISDHLKPETNRQLAQYPITLLQARFKKSSKMKSVKAAMSQLQEGQYDIVLIMNADNVVDTNFLEVVNNTYASGSNAIQTHRIYQERPSNVSILNAITDEINNSILRAGHVNLGLSASLNGSGTAIDFTWFKENIRHLKDDDDEKVIESPHSLTERKRRLSAENPPSLYRPPQHSVGAHRILFMCSLHFLSGFFHKVVDFAYLAERCVIPGHSVQYEI